MRVISTMPTPSSFHGTRRKKEFVLRTAHTSQSKKEFELEERRACSSRNNAKSTEKLIFTPRRNSVTKRLGAFRLWLLFSWYFFVGFISGAFGRVAHRIVGLHLVTEYIIQERHRIGSKRRSGCRALGCVRVRVLKSQFCADWNAARESRAKETLGTSEGLVVEQPELLRQRMRMDCYR